MMFVSKMLSESDNIGSGILAQYSQSSFEFSPASNFHHSDCIKVPQPLLTLIIQPSPRPSLEPIYQSCPMFLRKSRTSNIGASPQQHFLDSCFCGMIGKASRSGCCVAFGRLLAISTKSALTLLAFFAEVSMCKIPFSSAYSLASLKSTLRRASRSALLPA